MASIGSTCYWAREDAPNPGDDDLIQQTTLRAIDDSMPTEEERGHIGMSEIGKKDDRSLWLKFRWSLPDQPEPRVKRIFRVGHILEAEVIALLKNIPGVTVYDRDPSTGAQFNFSFLGGHFSGSMDGCILGIPEAPRTWHVLEIKTVSAKCFVDLQKKGVAEWSPKYYTQLQCYIGASGMERALFIAYCKDNSELYIERVKPEPMFFDAMLVKAERIIERDAPPESSYPKREWYEAKSMSDGAQAVYWGDALPSPNCRNCRFSSPRMDRSNGSWWCGLKQEDLTIGNQRIGCDWHNYIPALMPAELKALSQQAAIYMTQDGTEFVNGKQESHQPNLFGSKELQVLSEQGLSAATLADPVINEFRTRFDATVKG